jgi:hypothetical protein
MKNQDQDRHKTSRGERGEYDIGYRKPPSASQFPPGQSGNPSGRKKHPAVKVSTLEDPYKNIIRDELYRVIKIKDDEKELSVTAVQLIVRRMAAEAIKGNVKSAFILINLLILIERENSTAAQELFKTALEVKNDMFEKKRKAKHKGRPEPKFDIEPWDIITDLPTGKVVILDSTDRKFNEDLAEKLGEEAKFLEALKANPQDEDAKGRLIAVRRTIEWLIARSDQIAAENNEKRNSI